MNKRIKDFERESHLDVYGLGLDRAKWEYSLEKFVELILQECVILNKKQSYELLGVIVDTEEHDGFDDICLDTVKRVEQYLSGNNLLKHFGVEL
jgi:hypothetical protein